MKRQLQVILTAAVATVLCATACAQQPDPDHWSLEAMASHARIVFKGYITDIVRLDIDPKPGKPATARITLTIHTQDRLKGSPDSWMTLDRVILASDIRWDAWMKAKTPLLWFRFSEEDPKAYPAAQIGPGLNLPPGQSWSVVDFDAVDPAELTVDPHASVGDFSSTMTVLTNGKEKTEAVRKFVKSDAGKDPVVRVLVPAAMCAAIGYPSAPQHLILPVTPELETTAIKMINSPESFLGKDASGTDKTAIRAAGIKALSKFKSEKNAALLKSLLSDPGRGPSSTPDSGAKTFFWVRSAAYSALTSWSIAVAKPTL